MAIGTITAYAAIAAYPLECAAADRAVAADGAAVLATWALSGTALQSLVKSPPRGARVQPGDGGAAAGLAVSRAAGAMSPAPGQKSPPRACLAAPAALETGGNSWSAPDGLIERSRRPRPPNQRNDHAGLLRSRRRHQPDQGQEGLHRRLRQPGPCPCAEPEGFRRQGRRDRAAQGLDLGAEGRGRRLQGDGSRRGRQMGRRDDDADPGRIAGRHLSRAPARQHEERRSAAVRPWPQRAFQPARSARRSRRADDRAEGPRPHRALGISARRRRALPDRDPQGFVRQRP